MKILVTAGNTETPIDQVRAISNIFSGNTGTRIAVDAYRRGHSVTLLTSRPDAIARMDARPIESGTNWKVVCYRTFEDLHRAMAAEILSEQYDAVIHVAAVSDYQVVGTYGVADDTAFHPATCTWQSHHRRARLVDAAAGKVKSNHDELWLRLKPTPKLVDLIRKPWGFDGVLVKFKLEVGIDEQELRTIAERSRIHSQADLIAANTLEGMHEWALIKEANHDFERIKRPQLADELLNRVERNAAKRFAGLRKHHTRASHLA